MENYDIIILGSLIKNNDYLGSRTLYLYNILQKYLPTCKIGVYDVYEQDDKRINKDSAKNYIFMPWIETFDSNWFNFFMSLPESSKKILYTDDFYWYKEQKKKLLKIGINLENVFNTIAFSSKENIPGEFNYSFWGIGVSGDFDVKEDRKEKYLFVDSTWDHKLCQEPYNALRVLNECIPQIKEKHPEYKIVSYENNASWVDINLKQRIPLEEIIKYYALSDAYIVSHRELYGIAQVEARMTGTKIITTKTFSNNTILLPGPKTFELWSFEDGNKSFINAVENCIAGYDRNIVIEDTKISYDNSIFFENVKKDLFSIEF